MVSSYFQFSHGSGRYLDQLQTIIDETGGQRLIVSLDSNTHSRAWYSEEEDDRGDEMLDLIMRNNLTIINQPHQPATQTSGTNIDLTLCSQNLRDMIRDWKVHEGESLSDHRLITFILDLKFKRKLDRVGRFNVRNVNYSVLNNNMAEGLEVVAELAGGGQIDANEAARQLVDTIYRSCERKIKKSLSVRSLYPGGTRSSQI